ncbi:MAG: GTP cyclohydrolase II [Candidatus Sumerlaeales bacterium]|nr:GTP cyclohydrolase II [Candidatus Sumerlaeales bacterium]
MLCKIEEAFEEIRSGHMMILVDDEDRENEGDLVMAAEFVTPEAINFFITHGRGLLCFCAYEKELAHLNLSALGDKKHKTRFGTNFYEPVDATENTTTGVSAADRATTILKLADPTSTEADFAKPGHIHTLGAQAGGVLVRMGQTEGIVDLTRLSGVRPCGILCEIMNEDGTMARMPDLEKFAAQHNLKITTVHDLIQYRLRHEKLVTPCVTVELVNEFGKWNLTYYESWQGEGHIALWMGDLKSPEPVLVRVHSECFTGDTLGSLRCDCGPQLSTAMKRIADEGRGAIVYLRQEGRGIGLKNKLFAYDLQLHEGLDTVDANIALGFKPDLREYGVGAQILVDLGITKMRLLTNNPRKIVGLKAYGLEVVERVPIMVGRGEYNEKYLDTKKCRMGHIL